MIVISIKMIIVMIYISLLTSIDIASENQVFQKIILQFKKSQLLEVLIPG